MAVAALAGQAVQGTGPASGLKLPVAHCRQTSEIGVRRA